MSDEPSDDEYTTSEPEELTEDEVNDSDGETANNFVDWEAEEQDYYSQSDDDASQWETSYEFPHFTSLPIELREIVWGFFDPSLKSTGRVFNYMVDNVPSVRLIEKPVLDAQTAPMKAMMAVHRESRLLAVKHYPHVTSFNKGELVLRFNREQDIVYLEISHNFVHEFRKPSDAAELAAVLSACGKAVALQPVRGFGTIEYVLECAKTHMEDRPGSLEAVFLDFNSTSWPYWSCALAWCGLDATHTFYIHSGDAEDMRRGEDLEYMYCWPDRTKDQAVFNDVLQKNDVALIGRPYVFPDFVYPIVQFPLADGVAKYDTIKERVLKYGQSFSDLKSLSDLLMGGEHRSPAERESDESGSESQSDEIYELDGFVVDDTVGGGDDVTDDDVSAFDGPSASSSQGIRNGEGTLHSADGADAARFSSLEPESPNGSLGSATSEGEGPAIRMASRPKRRNILSDDEDDVQEAEEGEVERRPRPKKRTRIVMSDSEDENEAGENGPDEVDSRARERSGNEDKEDEGGSEEEEDEEEEESSTRARPTSLFAKLQQFRSDNPISQSASEAGSDAASPEMEDDFQSGEDFQDDEGDGDELEHGAGDDMIDELGDEEGFNEEGEEHW